MDIKHLLTAEDYQADHKVRQVHNLILDLASGDRTLLGVLEMAWMAGYDAKEREDTDRLRHRTPAKDALSEAEARRLLATHYPDRADPARVWTWEPAVCGWYIDNDDCSIRPGEGGLIVMEAGGEFSGEVLTIDGRAYFDEDTFR